MLETIFKHWAVFAWCFTMMCTIVGYGIRNWRAVAEMEVATKKLTLDHQTHKDLCDLREKEALVAHGKLSEKIDDYHISAVAREVSLKQEMTTMLDKHKIEVMEKQIETERQMNTYIKDLGGTLNNIEKTLLSISLDNKSSNEKIADLIKEQEKSRAGREDFYKTYGGALQQLPEILKKHV